MFLKYYNLREQPFGVTPDPRCLYLGSKHREALASLMYGTETERGFLALIAPPGMGKTSLLFQYLESLRGTARTAYVFQTDCDPREFLRHILTDLGLDASGKDLAALHEMLNRALLEELHAGRRFVLVIDEAQNLEEKVLESVRLLSNFETPRKKLIQIVMAGQPQLAEKLARPSMAQLRQRVSLIIRINRLTPEEVSAYIDHRLQFAGYEGPSLFTTAARRMIAQHSEGIPRNINNICFNAMSLGCALKRKTIDCDVIQEVLADLDLKSLDQTETDTPRVKEEPKPTAPPSHPARRWLPRFAVAAALLAAVIWSGSGFHKPIEQKAPAQSTAINEAPAITSEVAPGSHAPAAPADLKGSSDAAESSSIQVMPGQTLYEISVAQLGKYDRETLQELRTLNPWLTNPDYLPAGQRVRVPLAMGTPTTVNSGSHRPPDVSQLEEKK